MTEGEIVEIMARAIFADQGPDDKWENFAAQTHEDYRGHARATIEALKAHGFAIVPIEPTEAMIHDGFVADPLGYDLPNEDMSMIYGAIYRAMIQAAQKERETA